ncbi:hypothetical protein AAG570_009818 [Ranatra chinensis]|uniref:Prokaryotic-type class I peptide chain release factors domain-containing protein n=1 Tax=Ranatra chinensis TaxID=642074 RepID=A0ABD0YQS8_9HEMI
MLISLNIRHLIFPSSRLLVTDICRQSSKVPIDYSRVPVLREEDLEEKFVRGSGPGGQAVNKNNNCVSLKHLPTGIVIKCHQSRSQDVNRKVARELLVTKLDNLVNGDNSIENQMKVAREKKINETERRRRKLQSLKDEWKKREGLM